MRRISKKKFHARFCFLFEFNGFILRGPGLIARRRTAKETRFPTIAMCDGLVGAPEWQWRQGDCPDAIKRTFYGMMSQHCKLLCVDDNAVVLEMLKAALEASGYHVSVAQNGFAALATVAKDPARFQVIVTDIRMPGMSGLELIERARGSGYHGKVIVYAALISPEDGNLLRELRVDRVVNKPALRADIVAAVNEVESSF